MGGCSHATFNTSTMQRTSSYKDLLLQLRVRGGGVLAAIGSHVWATVWTSLLAALLGWGLARHVSRRLHTDMHLIPGPWRHALPLLGNLLEVLRPDFHRVLLQWADQYGGIVRVKFLWHDGLVVTDPAALAVISGRGEGAMDKAADMYSPVNMMCTPHGRPNLLTSPADASWKAVRKAVALSFAFGNIKTKFPLVRERTEQLVEWLRAMGPGQDVDVDQAALRVTLDVIGLSAFGHDYGCVRLDAVPPSHLLRVLPRAFTEVMRRVANPLRGVAPGLFKNGPKGRQSFSDFQTHMRQLLREMLARGPPPPSDRDIGAQLARVLLAARQEAEKQQQKGEGNEHQARGRGSLWRLLRGGGRSAHAITEERILSEIGILFVEGFETTGHTISWTLFNVATTPGVQEAAAAELAAAGLLVRPPSECGRAAARPLELDDLKRLPYITACIKEAMRMFPVVSIMGKVTDKPLRVGPYRVPAGTPVATPLFAIHNTHHNWVEPHAFKPERWLDVPVESYVLDMRAREGITQGPTPGLSPSPHRSKQHPQPHGSGPAGAMAMAAAAAPAGPADNPKLAASAADPLAHGFGGGSGDDSCGVSSIGSISSNSSMLTNRTGNTSTLLPTVLSHTSSIASGSGSGSMGPWGRGHASSGAHEEDEDDVGGAGGHLPASARAGISYMPFSEGPRSCVGQSLAKMEVLTVVALLLANFRIRLADEMGGREGIRRRESTHLTLQTAGTRGIRMHLTPRDQEQGQGA